VSIADKSPAEILAEVAAQVERQSAKPLQEQVSALEAAVMMLGVGFLRQQRVIERLVRLLEEP